MQNKDLGLKQFQVYLFHLAKKVSFMISSLFLFISKHHLLFCLFLCYILFTKNSLLFDFLEFANQNRELI